MKDRVRNRSRHARDADFANALRAQRIDIRIVFVHDSNVDRANIGRLVKQAISLMPEGLSEAMTQQDLVNLVEYLESLKP